MTLRIGNKKVCPTKLVLPNTQNITITQNGTYTPDEGYTGFSTVEVDVAGGGGTSEARYITQGTLTNNDNVLSGFSTSAFAVVPYGSNTENYITSTLVATGASVYMYIGFTTPSSFSTDEPLIATSNGSTNFSDIFINNVGQISFWSGSALTSTSHTCQPSTYYGLRYRKAYGSSTFYLDITTSTDDLVTLSESDWTQIGAVSSTGNWYNAYAYSLGRGNTQYFNGSIDMNKFAIKRGDTIIYRGVEKA